MMKTTWMPLFVSLLAGLLIFSSPASSGPEKAADTPDDALSTPRTAADAGKEKKKKKKSGKEEKEEDKEEDEWDVSNPPGEWNYMQLTLNDGKLTVWQNGKDLVKSFDTSKGQAVDGGSILIRSADGGIQFRNMRIKAIKK